MLPIVLVGVALFFLAFVGLNKLWPTVFGLAAIMGLIFGVYFIWLGVSQNSNRLFVWGAVLLLGAGGFLIYLKSVFSD